MLRRARIVLENCRKINLSPFPPANKVRFESTDKSEEIICTGILEEGGIIKLDVPLLDYYEVGEEVKVTLFLQDEEDLAS